MIDWIADKRYRIAIFMGILGFLFTSALWLLMCYCNGRCISINAFKIPAMFGGIYAVVVYIEALIKIKK